MEATGTFWRAVESPRKLCHALEHFGLDKRHRAASYTCQTAKGTLPFWVDQRERDFFVIIYASFLPYNELATLTVTLGLRGELADPMLLIQHGDCNATTCSRETCA